MIIEYSPTYELKGDLGYDSPIGIKFKSIDELKDRITEDYNSQDFRIASLDISINETVSLYFDFPRTLKVFYHSNDIHYQIAKFESYSVPDLVHYLEEYV